MIHTDGWEWRRWRGTLDDLVVATRVALDDVARWKEGEAIEFSMRAQLRPQREMSSTDPVDLDSLGERDPRTVKSLSLTVGGWGPPSVQISIDRSEIMPALSIEVKGEDESRVHGLTGRLRERLSPGRPWLQLYVRPTLLVVGAVTLVASMNLALLYARDRVGLVPLLAVTALTPISAALYVLMPGLELLRAGQPTRWRRYGRYVVAAVAFVASLLGIYAVVAGD